MKTNDVYAWTTPSANSGESMPIGGAGLGLNVWVEQGELLIYFQQSGAYDEHSAFLKMGRLRCRFGTNILQRVNGFRQELDVAQGVMTISGIGDESADTVQIKIWVDLFQPVFHLDFSSASAKPLSVVFESWRTKDRVSPAEHAESQIFGERNDMFDFWCYPHDLIRHKDTLEVVSSNKSNAVCWYHQNDNSDLAFDKDMDLQGLASVKDRLYNPQKNLIFGGMVVGEGLVERGAEEGIYLNTPYQGLVLESAEAQTNHRVSVFCLKDRFQTSEEWTSELNRQMRCYFSVDYAEKQAATRLGWQQFWQQSWIEINPQLQEEKLADEVRQVSRNYRLFRFMQGFNQHGSDPVKFNGGLLSYDSLLVHYLEDQRDISYLHQQEEKVEEALSMEALEAHDKMTQTRDYGPDYRAWGGGSLTLQNQRLLYWPMLKTGDFSLMTPQLDWFPAVLDATLERVKLAWGHGGSCYTEQISEFGIPIGSHYGWERPEELGYGDQISESCVFHYSTQLEFSYMMLLYHQYSGRDISKYMEFINEATEFFFEHYEYWAKKEGRSAYDENGQLIIFPSTALESYKDATNPNDVTCALRRIYSTLLEFDFISPEQRNRYTDRLKKVPPVCFREMKGKTVIAPAKSWSHVNNVELPQMYPVYPYEYYGVHKPDLQLAIDTWQVGSNDRVGQKSYSSWHQDGIFCAHLGLVDEAKELLVCKLADGGRKFPAFWGPGHDWAPDHNWGGTGMIQLQDMLMQCDGKQILLLPCWPKDWDVSFKLHAPFETTVECTVKAGKLTKLTVLPATRLIDVIVIPDR